MIPQQLSLFGPPVPPKKIKKDESPSAKQPSATEMPVPESVAVLMPDAPAPEMREVVAPAPEALPEPADVPAHEEETPEFEPQEADVPMPNHDDISFPAGASTRGRKPLADIHETADLLNIPPDEELYRRQYYSMRETAAMFKVNQSLLRFWENEFDILQPKKNKKGDRYFRPIDIRNLELIYHLLRVRKYTIEGAREYLRNANMAADTFELVRKLEKLRSFLLELKANL
jgi:DNA-binding transcriptional MerR regulator